MKTPEEIFDEAIKAKGLDVVSVKDADLYEAGLDAIKQALSIAFVVGRSEQLGEGKIRCNSCHKVVDKDYCSYLNCRLKA